MSTTLTEQTPLRRLVKERSVWLVIAELVNIVGELEEQEQGEKWARVGIALRSAREHADEHSDGLKEGV